MQTPADPTARCRECGNAGWVTEANPSEWPITVQVIPCIQPGCGWSGRRLAAIEVPHGVPVRPYDPANPA